MLPLAMGTGISMGFFGMGLRESLAVGASLAPTSMGISLKVLAESKVLTTPVGQLIIAAAVIDDVIALVLLSELEALENPTLLNFIVPIISSLAFIFGVGSFAVFVMPRVMRWALPRISETYLSPLLLSATLLTTYVMLPATHYAKSSYLLGSFLGGLCFCTAEPLMPVWHNSAYQILSWLLRVFFACTLGFEVPIQDLWSGPILVMTAAFLLVFFGKFVTGIFGSPLTVRNFSIIGFAMSAWGEFAFIVATASRETGTMSEDVFGAVVLAVLLSAFYSPLATQLTISITDRRAAAAKLVKPSGDSEDGVLHRVYYKVELNVKNRWGLTDKLLREIHHMELDVVEFNVRSISSKMSRFLIFTADQTITAPLLQARRSGKGDQITGRKIEIKKRLADALDMDEAEMLEAARLSPAAGADEDLASSIKVERFQPTLDDAHPENDDVIAYEEARNFCAPPPLYDAGPATLGGLVRRSMHPKKNLERASANPSPAQQHVPGVRGNRLGRYSMDGRKSMDASRPLTGGASLDSAAAGIQRHSGGAGMQRNSLTRLSGEPVESAPGKMFSLARQSGQPIVMQPSDMILEGEEPKEEEAAQAKKRTQL